MLYWTVYWITASYVPLVIASAVWECIKHFECCCHILWNGEFYRFSTDRSSYHSIILFFEQPKPERTFEFLKHFVSTTNQNESEMDTEHKKRNKGNQNKNGWLFSDFTIIWEFFTVFIDVIFLHNFEWDRIVRCHMRELKHFFCYPPNTKAIHDLYLSTGNFGWREREKIKNSFPRLVSFFHLFHYGKVFPIRCCVYFVSLFSFIPFVGKLLRSHFVETMALVFVIVLCFIHPANTHFPSRSFHRFFMVMFRLPFFIVIVYFFHFFFVQW